MTSSVYLHVRGDEKFTVEELPETHTHVVSIGKGACLMFSDIERLGELRDAISMYLDGRAEERIFGALVADTEPEIIDLMMDQRASCPVRE